MFDIIFNGFGSILYVGFLLAIPFLIIIVVMFFRNMDRRLENIEVALGIRSRESDENRV